MQENSINGGQPGPHSKALSQTKQKCIFVKNTHFIVRVYVRYVCEYGHAEAMDPGDLNSGHQACTVSPFTSLNQLSSRQVYFERKE